MTGTGGGAPLLTRGATETAPNRGCVSILREDFVLELELHREADREVDERSLELGTGECVGDSRAAKWEGELDVGKKGEGKEAGV
jgi:hypothetical protein